MKTSILTVTQLTAQIKDLLEDTFPEVWISGEISNLSIPQSGHAYFTLKDEQSQIRAVLFRQSQRFLKFTLQHGMQVICRGRVGVYEPRGEYQMALDYIEPLGVGALQKAFEELKTRLDREGLFASEHKKQLPMLPRRIGIITSPTGAAIHDILRVIKRRHPRMHILLYPIPVQGPEAAPSLVEAVRYFNYEKNVDVIILGRGGGSLEDLWAFNEESVARAIHASRIPIISAVGHETDYTITDFVSDLRAPTPSAAAEMVVESEDAFYKHLGMLKTDLVEAMRRILTQFRVLLSENLLQLKDPRKKLEQQIQRIDELGKRLITGFSYHLRRDRALLQSLTTALDHLNPLHILARGYSITTVFPSETILRNASQVAAGDLLITKVHTGEILSRVEDQRKPFD
ncbi:MAG: exodeoxyribonuclease VII large subunit [Nitrospirota bacterium]